MDSNSEERRGRGKGEKKERGCVRGKQKKGGCVCVRTSTKRKEGSEEEG